MVLPEVTTLAEARDAIRDLAEEVEKLSNELAWFKRQMFGSKPKRNIIFQRMTPHRFFLKRNLQNHRKKFKQLPYPNMNGKFVSRMHCPRFPPTCRVKNA